ncbi:MAG: adenylate/guanylate cyclase domain-containing protein [Actinomycetota bacterium]
MNAPAGVVPPEVVPAGIVTFLFTDVEGSTRLWAADAARTAHALQIHDDIVKDAITARRGYVFGWAGDHFRGAFEDPKAAVAAAMAAQAALDQADWGGSPPLRVRMGLHRGRANQRDGDYFGPVPNTAARVEALANGGQILLTDAVRNAVDIETVYLGSHRLRDVPEPVDIHQVGIASHRPLRAVDHTLTTLPAAGSAIIGREDEIREIRALLESASMVTLTGIGGCGKTRLAVEVGYQELPGRLDGCYFADLSAVSDGAELPGAIARAVRFEISGAADPLSQIVDHLATRDALLILDNCEHILSECADVADELLRRSSATALLATTRQRLGVAGEVVVAVPSLSHDDPSSPAIELFLERAKAANPAYEPLGQDRFTIGEICARLDGMPLAIELAAARIAVLSPLEILDRMADRFRLLSGGIGRHRRRTLQATLDWSYDLLTDDEQRFFRRLGLFVGQFDLPAASAVCDLDEYDAMDVLQSLVAKNLVATDVDPDSGPTRYRLLETVRIYAGDELARAEDADRAQSAYVAHYQRLATARSFAQAAGLDRAMGLSWQWPNISATLEHLTVDDRWVDAAAVAFGVQGLFDTQEIPAVEGRRWMAPILDALDRQLATAESLGAPADPRTVELRDWMRYALAQLLMQVDDFPETHRLLELLLHDDDATPGPQAQAAGLFAFLCCRQHGDRVAGLADLGRRLSAEHQLGPNYLLPSEWALACRKLYSGDFQGAHTGFGQAHLLAVAGHIETNQFVMSGLSLAATAVMTGNPAQALVTLDTCDWSRSVWDSSPIVRAVALIDLGRVDEAADLVISFGYAALLGRLARMANDALVGFAALALHRGEGEHAWKLLQEGASPRSPFTIVLAEFLAERIGHGPALRHMHRERVLPLSTLDATPALRAELDRIRSTRA